MKIQIGLVTENSQKYLNQVKLCLFSLRKNGGKLKDVPVTLVINGESLSLNEQQFFEKHFSPIEFKVMPRLGAIPHTSKLNIFYAIEPDSYDVLFYLDCDTVIIEPLDDILTPIVDKQAEFLCRRGGNSDRNTFVHFDSLVKKYCGAKSKEIHYEGKAEWPMFNTGVFLATSDAVQKIRKNSIEFTYDIFNTWQKVKRFEETPILKNLYKFKILKPNDLLLESWPIEQGGLALSCIKSGITIKYLDEKYNSWGNLDDLKTLHCFKSAYKFDRTTMFSDKSSKWIKEYEKSKIPGKRYLAKVITEYKNHFNK